MNLHEQLAKVQMDLLAERANGQQKDQDRINQLESQEASLLQQIMEATNQQAHAGRIQEAAAESENILDDIEIAGVPIAESGLSELAFKILNAKVQAKFVAKVESLSKVLIEQQTQSLQEIKVVMDRAVQAETTVSKLQTENKDLEVANYQLGLDNDALGVKVTKGAEMLTEATATIEEQKVTIEDYKKKELQGYSVPQKVVLTTSEQVAQQEAQLKASQIPVTSMAVDPNDFAKKTWIITTVSPVEVRNIHYFEKGLYRVVSQEEAEQIRAAIEQQNAAIPVAAPVATEDIAFVNDVVLEQVAPAQEPTFQADQVDTTAVGLVTESPSHEGQVVESESEVVTRAEFNKRVGQLEIYVKQLNDRAGLIPADEQAVA